MLPVNPKIFKAYDIRGIYQQDFDDVFAYNLGLAFVELRKSEVDYRPEKKLKLAVAADMRFSSPALKERLIAGLLAAGADVIDLGMIATPTFYFAVGYFKYDGGLMVSASHNPKEWNGFKLVRDFGIPVSGESGINLLKEKIVAGKLITAAIPGQLTLNPDALKIELENTLKAVSKNKIKPLKIVIDAASGMGSTYLEPLFSELSCQLIPLNFTLDGSFPAHEADPLKEENMKELGAAVLDLKADLGIATDGDGDRVFFVDNSGKTISPALIRGLLAKIFLKEKPGAKIGYDARPGKITTDLIKEAGGVAIMTRVGHSLIKEQMLAEDIFFAGESSGHFFLQGAAGCFEYPGLMIVKLLEYFSSIKESSINQHLHQYHRYFHSGEINRIVKDKELVFEKILKHYPDALISRLDGLSVTYPNFWFNVRASNTEALIRLNLEADSYKTMEEKRDEVLSFIF